jgi:hypothetical protein
MIVYRIERAEITNIGAVDSCKIGREFKTLEECNGKIMDYAESHRKNAWKILHLPGQSIVFFKTFRIEFSRLPNIAEGF